MDTEKLESNRLCNAILKSQYRVLDRIAKGGMSQLYLAEDILHTNRLECILKLSDNEASGKIIQEFSILSKLRHKNIARAQDLFFIDKRIPVMVIERLWPVQWEKSKTESLEWICSLFLHFMNILEYLHFNKYAHLDIKPDNIMFRNRTSSIVHLKHISQLVLTDFGLCRELGTRTIAGEFEGTIQFAPPGTVPWKTSDSLHRHLFNRSHIL